MEEGHANGAHSRRPRQAVAFPKFPERLPALGPGPQRKHKPGIRARAKQQLHDVAVAGLCRQEQRRHAIHQALVGRAPCAGVVPHSLARPTCRPPNQVVHYGRVASQRRGVQAGATCRGRGAGSSSHERQPAFALRPNLFPRCATPRPAGWSDEQAWRPFKLSADCAHRACAAGCGPWGDRPRRRVHAANRGGPAGQLRCSTDGRSYTRVAGGHELRLSY